MSEITTHLVEDVLPVARYRQWTLSVPWRVRVLLMVHPELVSGLQRLLVRVLSTYARRQARDLMAVRGTPLRRGAKLLTGAVVSIQRFGWLSTHCDELHFYLVRTAVFLPLSIPWSWRAGFRQAARRLVVESNPIDLRIGSEATVDDVEKAPSHPASHLSYGDPEPFCSTAHRVAIPQPCPICQAKFVLKKETKRGTTLRCMECDWRSEGAEESEENAA